jgi:hypothetical protein
MATVRQLGYPTKNALKGWHREYERRLDLPKGYARSKPKYPQEQKEVAVRHHLDSPSRRWAIRYANRCVPGFTNRTPSCTCALSVDLTR